jgi:outer membrane protein OmpA-like peptidoglycan-associated protein/tetratricopeptide (TPR) repeat protein
MKKILLTATVVACIASANAQFTYDYLKAADTYFKKGDYYSASLYYEKYLGAAKGKGNETGFKPYTVQQSSKKAVGKEGNQQQALYNLAESYRQLNYYVKAAPYYKQVVDENSTQYPLARYYYATTLRAQGQYGEAALAFNAFLASYPQGDEYMEAAKREVANLQFIQQQLGRKDLNLFTVNKFGTDLNAKGATYAPSVINNTLFFTSTRPDSTAGKNAVHDNRIYQAAFANGTISGIAKVDLPQQKEVHQGVVSAAPDGNTLFLTRWSTQNGKKTSQLYASKRTEIGWSEPLALDQTINAPGTNTQQPFVTPDGKYLLFASDRSGGLGGFDLWMAELDANGKLTNAVNMGAAVNTKYDEQAPYYHAPSQTLVFSTNGRVGMGGYDFFYSKGTFDNWAEPVNFGYPVNSVKDDMYFLSQGDGKNILSGVLLSSDRSAECCLELFALNKVRPQKQIKGSVAICDTKEPLAGTTLTIVNEANQPVYTTTVGADGSYTFTVEDYAPLKAVAAKEGYREATLAFNAPESVEAETLQNPVICLTKVPVVGTTEVMDNIYYQFNKAYLLDASFASLDKLVATLKENPNMTIEIGGHTDSRGNDGYNQKLSEQRAQSVIDYLISKGIAKERLQAKGYGESQPIAPNQNPDGRDNPAGREKNRRTELKILSN